MIEKEKEELEEKLKELDRKLIYSYSENYNHKIVVEYKKIKLKIAAIEKNKK